MCTSDVHIWITYSSNIMKGSYPKHIKNSNTSPIKRKRNRQKLWIDTLQKKIWWSISTFKSVRHHYLLGQIKTTRKYHFTSTRKLKISKTNYSKFTPVVIFDRQVSSPSTCLLTYILAHWRESLGAPFFETSQKFELGKPWPTHRSTTPQNIKPKQVTPSDFLKPFSDLSLLCSILPPPPTPPQEGSYVSNEHFYTFWQICGVISLGIWTKFWMGGAVHSTPPVWLQQKQYQMSSNTYDNCTHTFPLGVWHSTSSMEKLMAVSYKAIHATSFLSIIFSPRHLPKRNENRYPKRLIRECSQQPYSY